MLRWCPDVLAAAAAAPYAARGGSERLLPTLAFVLCLLTTTWAAASGPVYLLAGPEIIRPGANLTIGVELLKASPPRVTVKGEVVFGNNSVLHGEAVFQRDSLGTLVLPALPLESTSGQYDLYVSGYSEGRLLFSNHTALSFEPKSFSVFIQTDKSVYKPGQEVKIRVVTLYPDLKPFNAPVNLYIRDPRRNLIQQWLSENGKLGKITKQFKLSRHPILGDWSLEVEVNGQAHYQTFTVMEYELPKFEVFLTTPLYYSPKDTHFNGTVTAKYTYGMPVKGKLTLSCFSLFYGKKKNITKIFEINGSVNFTLNSAEIKNITYEDWNPHIFHQMPLEITAVVTETLTRISQNVSASAFPKHQDYSLEFTEHSQVLKPSLNFMATLKVTRLDNKPLTSEERRNKVTVTVEPSRRGFHFMYDEENVSQMNEVAQNLSYTVPEDGVIQIEFPTEANTTQLKVKAKFLESYRQITIDNIFYSDSKTYLLIKKTSQDVKVGTPLELKIQSNRPVKEISYMVMSKEQIVAVGKKKSTRFILTPENSWAPTAFIVAYYVSDNGEVINDALSLPVQPDFKNQINMHWNKKTAGPSEPVSLKISVTDPESSIGLLVVDKSTKLLGKRSDITEEAVLHELSLYSTTIHYAEARNSYSVFQKCNLWVRTDASISEHEDYDVYYGLLDGAAFDDYQLENTAMPADFGNPHVRTNFPETWIWQEITTRSTEATLNVTVPDTITSWVASAFIISENLGLGVLKMPIELEVFQPFFISLNLPPSVTRGEQFILEVNIFNYLKEGTEVTVTLDTSDTFEILTISNVINAMGNQRSVWVPSEDGKTVIFPIKPKQIGEVPIRVTAISAIASDALLQKVLVKAEGIEQFHSQALFLDLSRRRSLTESLNFTFPSGVVPGSERVQISVIGDILGPSITGMESLIKMPHGCGEQNMINFAPNIYVLDYLSKTGNLQSNIKLKAMSYMREGYQRELLYQRDDGSFSAFGNSDHSGSTWLSAFVLRSFIQAEPFIDIDPYILERTAAWIASHQKSSGEFREPGRVLNTELQGGTNSSISLTAYIMAALLEYQTDKYGDNIRRALNFLEYKLSEGIADNHTLAVVTYALSLARSVDAKMALDTLNQRSEKKGELRFWMSPSSELSDSWQPRSVDIEAAGYALLSHAKQQRLLEGIPIMKWLSQQRNHLGGYSSTQDTIVALQALSTCAMLTASIETEMDVAVDPSSEEIPLTFRLDNKNRFLLRTKEIAATQPVGVTVSANGRGFGIFQLNIMYNVKSSHDSRRRRSTQSQEAFDLNVIVKDDKKDINHMTLNVCTKYLGTGPSSRSGMALIEVGLLSGFSLSPSFVSVDESIKKVEKDNGKIHLYLDSLNETQVCVDIPAVRDFKVANVQDASVTVLDYYEPRRRAVRSYNSKVMQHLSSCTFCEKDKCDFCETDGSSLISISCELLVLPVILLYSWLI